ncbi:Ig-like domain-containing protein [Motilimonas sp. 1_MG-2023]|uniref:PKD domain-containing protein n=1 Tax=Motilimonas sp. 1_MG-2023 TaxID=3062672 RepID=UPI0026E27DF8|nr:Ig-like domain-containing protein [Motilimonas sp. 1_MG-2023]MDO6525250.1 Ig-like domain-containing protein [Motilimonas sp. 1_MG-2023]
MKKVLVLSTLFLSPLTFANSVITLNSDPGDWIGGGQSHTLNGEFTSSIEAGKITISHPSGFNFTFRPPNDRNLAPGAYLNAERDAFKGPFNAGMAVGATGRGCNKITGEFYIYEMDLNTSAPSLALDFVQYCDSTDNKLEGSIRINNDALIPYQLPLAVIQKNAGQVVEGGDLVLDGSRSKSNTSTIDSYYWEYVSGPTISIINPTAAQTQIAFANDIALGGEDLTLKLSVTDSQGLPATTIETFHVASKSDPRSFFTMRSSNGDYIGQGKVWNYDSANSLMTARKNYDNGVSVSIQGSESWTANFAAADEAQLTSGRYLDATRFPFQAAGVAGLSVSGDGRGCNKSIGNFEVLQLAWSKGQPEQFSATFEQRCENSAALLKGEIAINALHPSVPSANAGESITVTEHKIVNLNGSGSFDRLGELASYQWSASGLTITNTQDSRAHFIAPALADREQSQTFDVQLLVKDNEGYQANDIVTVTVLADNQAPLAVNDQVEVIAGEATELTPLDNDVDPDGTLQQDSIVIKAQPQFGSVAVNAQGVLTYTATDLAQESDRLTYVVLDNDGAESNVATIEVVIKAKVVEPNWPEFVLGKTVVKNGDIVAYNGSCYQAKNNPGLWEAPKANSWFWEQIACDTSVDPTEPDVLAWQTNQAYNAGDVVTYSGLKFQARWWTKGVQPDPSNIWGVWKKLD